MQPRSLRIWNLVGTILRKPPDHKTIYNCYDGDKPSAHLHSESCRLVRGSCIAELYHPGAAARTELSLSRLGRFTPVTASMSVRPLRDGNKSGTAELSLSLDRDREAFLFNNLKSKTFWRIIWITRTRSSPPRQSSPCVQVCPERARHAGKLEQNRCIQAAHGKERG